MYIRQHFFITLLACIILYPSAGLLNCLVVLAFGVLIDGDHYLYYVFTKHDFSIRRGIHYFTKLKDANRILLIFHGVEWAVPLMIISMFFEPAWYALLGFTIHMVLDYLDSKINPDGRNLSLLCWWLNNKK